MQQLKIAFIVPDMVIGGLETVFIQTLDCLSKSAQVKVVIHTTLQEPFYIEWFKKHPDIKLYTLYPLCRFFEKLRKYTRVFPLSNIRKIVFSLYKKAKNRQAIHKGLFSDCDVIIDYKNCQSAKIMKFLPNKKIAWIHGSINFFNEYNLIKDIPSYDKVVCITKSFLDDFLYQYPEYKKKITHIYNPINYKEISELSKQLSCPSGKYFCVVSRLDKDKDIATVINAFDIFWHKENKPDIKLIIVGDGTQTENLKKHANELESKKNIIFTGSIPIPFGYIRGAIAHILSSKNEGLGMVLLESAACETLNIASECKNGPAEILQNGDAGLLFTPGDEKHLADIMEKVWKNEVPRKEMIKKAKDNLQNFSVDKISEEIIKLIKETV